MRWLGLAILLLAQPSDAAIRCAPRVPCPITFTAFAVQPITVTATAHDGVLTVNWNGEERLAFYDEHVLMITLAEDGGTPLGGRLVWAGNPERLAKR